MKSKSKYTNTRNSGNMGKILLLMMFFTSSVFSFAQTAKLGSQGYDFYTTIAIRQANERIAGNPVLASVATAKEKNRKDRNCLSTGIFLGGGSYVGVDYEFLIVDYFGVQVGGGFYGFDMGLNIHFKPGVNTSFLSLQAQVQGNGSAYRRLFSGPIFVYRGKRWFTAQIGIGIITEDDETLKSINFEDNFGITAGIGGYFPW